MPKSQNRSNKVTNSDAKTMQSVKYKPSGLVGDVENVVEQSDACVVGCRLTQECNSSGAVQ